MKTSIVVLTYNNLEINKKCINSLLENTEGDFEIVIIDNNSIDGTVEYLNTIKDKKIKVILNKENSGFAGGCNQGAKNSSGEIVVFLNNDTEVKVGWLPPLLKAITEKGAAIAGSKLLYPDGLIQHAGIVISSDHIPRHIYRRELPNRPYVNREREFQAVTAACLAMKKSLFEKVGEFDEGYMNGLEDVDLCLKVKKMGGKILYCPESVVIHHESVSKDRFAHYFRNRDLYLSRWGTVSPDEDQNYREDGHGFIFIAKQHLNNRYLTGNYGTKIATVLKRFMGKED